MNLIEFQIGNLLLCMLPKLVILASRFPYPLEKGDKLRLYYQIKYLCQSFRISLLALSDEEVSHDDISHLDEYCESVHIFSISEPSRLVVGVKSLLRNESMQQQYFYNKKRITEIQNLIKSLNPDIIYTQLVRMSPYIKGVEGKKVIDIMDAFSLNMEKEGITKSLFLKWIYLREAKKLRAIEKECLVNFDAATIISERDRHHIDKSAENLYVVPNGVEVEKFCPDSSIEKVYDVGYIGNMGYAPNVEASVFLVNNIIKKYLPHTKVLIAGARPSQEVKNLADKQVEVTGWVDDICVSYQSCKVFVAPLFTGAGMQNKILEAMAIGIPCITTSYVNASLKAKPNEEIIIANSAKEFAENIDILLNNHEKIHSLGVKGRDFVKQSYPWDVQVNKLIKLLNQQLNEK